MRGLGIVALTLVLIAGAKGSAQAIATASGPGPYVSVGGGLSLFKTDYGHNNIAGGTVYVDMHPQWRVGFEGEARYLRWHANEQVTEVNYIGGMRVMLWSGRWSPYAKFLAGAGEITLPYHYGHGGFLTYAPGAGFEFAVNDRITVRAVDFEYQHWPQFTFGALSPYGISSGISVRLNGVSRFVKGPRARH